MTTPTQRAPLAPGQRVRVHVNLHRKDFSVLDPRTGRVVANVDAVTLVDVEFRTQPACLDRIEREQVRAVCAYAIGHLAHLDGTAEGRAIRFNPFRSREFHYDDGTPVRRAGRVSFHGLRAYEQG